MKQKTIYCIKQNYAYFKNFILKIKSTNSNNYSYIIVI